LIGKILKLSGTNWIIKAVITVPSNFNDNQREIIKSAFGTVGLQVIRIINEPSAAALAYGLSHSSSSDQSILVIDTGGGTMDFTILQKSDLFFEVVHSEGLNDLGGNNFTHLIVDDILRTGHFTGKETNLNDNLLWNQAQKIKEKLTWLDIWETNIKNIIPAHSFPYLLTQTKFTNLANSLIQKVENTLSEIISRFESIDYVILVGGTSRIPILQETISRVTGKTPWIHPNLESVVAEGAGFYAGIIENKFVANDDVVLMDVLPLSLGVELADGSFSIIVPKNTPLPIKRSQKYTTDTPGENKI
jgi:molecular chaperone DnaK